MRRNALRPGFTRKELLILTLLAAIFIVVILPCMLYSPFRGWRNPDKTKVMNQMRQIGMALAEFENEYGSFPSPQTRELLSKDGYHCRNDKDSNSYLSQLVAAGFLDGEEYFFAKGVSGTKLGDNNSNSPDEILGTGENVFGYVMLSNGSPLPSRNASPNSPIIVIPLLNGGTEPTFDPSPYNEKMFYFKLDGSVTEARIKADGKAGLKKGLTLFQTGPGTLWGDHQPDVKEPNLIR